MFRIITKKNGTFKDQNQTKIRSEIDYTNIKYNIYQIQYNLFLNSIYPLITIFTKSS